MESMEPMAGPGLRNALGLDWDRIRQELNLPPDQAFSVQIVRPKDPNQPITIFTRPVAQERLGSEGETSASSSPENPPSQSASQPSPPPPPSTLPPSPSRLPSLSNPPALPSIGSQPCPEPSSPLKPLQTNPPPPSPSKIRESSSSSSSFASSLHPDSHPPPLASAVTWAQPVTLHPVPDGTAARTRPYKGRRSGAKRLNLSALGKREAPVRPPSLPPLPGSARTRPFTNAESNSMREIQALSEPRHLLSFAAKSPRSLGLPWLGSIGGGAGRSVAEKKETAAPVAKRPRKQVFPPASPKKPPPEHMRRMGFLKASLTCARVRPVGGKSFSAARTRPFNGLRKERNWFYFMMHPERLGRYVSRQAVKARQEDLTSRQNKNPILSTEVPLPLQYRSYLQRPPKLFLSRSRIHRIGVFADEDLICGRLVLEYRGLVHRWSLCDRREQGYKAAGLGSYMFRLDDPSRHDGQVSTCLDATRWGSIARFINHSCDPNCAAKTITFEEERKIVLYTVRNVEKGEELSYNYNMPYEDEKLPCFCGARNCRKTLN